MASKGNVGQIITYILGGIASVLVILERLLDSGDPLMEIVRKEWPVLVLAVAVGLATVGAAWLLTLLGRKVRPSFRTRATRLKALVPEIEELHSRKSEQLLDAHQMDDMSVSHFLHRCDELRDRLSKLGIPSPMPLRGGFSRWRDFLRRLHASAIRGNVKEARGELERLDAYRKSVAARGGLFGEPTEDQDSGADRAPADLESRGGAS